MNKESLNKDKTTLWLSPENIAWVDTQRGSSRSWKVDDILTRMRTATASGELDQLVAWLSKKPPYVLGVTDKHGTTLRGRITLEQVLKNYIEETFGKPVDRKDDFLEVEHP